MILAALNKLRLCLPALLLVSVLGYSGVGAMTIAMIEDDPVSMVVKDVVLAAYEKLGIEVTFRPYPGRRSLVVANTGETDGELMRIRGTENTYTNLIRIPEPVYSFEGVAFTRHVNRDIRSWKDLQGLKVGIIRGIQYAEQGARQFKPYYAKNLNHLIKLLSHDRIDVAVAEHVEGESEIEKAYPASGIHIIGRPLHKAFVYHFVHKRHKDLVPRLEAVFRDMRKTGAMAEITGKAHRNPMIHQTPQ